MRLPCGGAGLEARSPGGHVRCCRAFPGARTSSPQRVRGAGRGAWACPLACGLGSRRSRKPPLAAAGHFLERGLSVRSGCGAQGAAHGPARWRCGLGSRRSRRPRSLLQGISWSADFQSAAGAWRRARRMGLPGGLRAWKPAVPEATARCCGAFPGARTSSPQRVRGAGRGAWACPLACGLGSRRSRKPPLAAAGHFLERGLSVRSGCGAQGAAHGPARWRCGLGSRRSRRPRSLLQGISWSADFQSAAGAWRRARRMGLPGGLRAWKPAVPEATFVAAVLSPLIRSVGGPPAGLSLRSSLCRAVHH